MNRVTIYSEGDHQLILDDDNLPKGGQGRFKCRFSGNIYEANWDAWRNDHMNTKVKVIQADGTRFEGIIAQEIIEETVLGFVPLSGTYTYSDGMSWTGEITRLDNILLPRSMEVGSNYFDHESRATFTKCNFNEIDKSFEVEFTYRDGSICTGTMKGVETECAVQNLDGTQFEGTMIKSWEGGFKPYIGEGTHYGQGSYSYHKRSGTWRTLEDGKKIFQGIEINLDGTINEYHEVINGNAQRVRIVYPNGEEFNGTTAINDLSNIISGEGSWKENEFVFRGVLDENLTHDIEVIYPDGTICVAQVNKDFSGLYLEQDRIKTHPTFDFKMNLGEYFDWIYGILLRRYPAYSLITNLYDIKAVIWGSSYTIATASGALQSFASTPTNVSPVISLQTRALSLSTSSWHSFPKPSTRLAFYTDSNSSSIARFSAGVLGLELSSRSRRVIGPITSVTTAAAVFEGVCIAKNDAGYGSLKVLEMRESKGQIRWRTQHRLQPTLTLLGQNITWEKAQRKE